MSRRFGPTGRLVRAVRATGYLLALGLLAGTNACLSDLLDVKIPSQVEAGLLDDPANARFLVAGTVGEAECGFGGYAVTGALFGWELDDASSFAGFGPEIDLRTVLAGGFTAASLIAGCGGGYTSYVPLSRARWQADDLLTKLKGWTDDQVPDRAAQIAKIATYSGYARVLLGEGFCSVALDTGGELQPADVFQQAEALFTEALAGSPATDILNMARVGRARARLNLGKYTEAAADAALVPIGFVKTAAFSTASTRRENKVFNQINFTGNATVNAQYRPALMRFQGVADPRVPVTDANRNGFNGTTRLWLQSKFPAKTSPMRVATWDEAQLIIAEERWRANDDLAAVAIINLLHSRTTPALPAFASTNHQAIFDQIVYERRAALFLEGQHLGDVRRLNLPLFPAAGALNERGNAYGAARCMPLPDIERNFNPNLSQSR